MTDAWSFTFTDSGRPTRRGMPRAPFVKRIRALAKDALRYYGLKAVADLPLIKLIFDRHCGDLCDDCAAGVAVKYDPAGTGVWWHPKTGSPCGAHRLRVKDQERRRATDACVTDAVPALRPAAGGG